MWMCPTRYCIVIGRNYRLSSGRLPVSSITKLYKKNAVVHASSQLPTRMNQNQMMNSPVVRPLSSRLTLTVAYLSGARAVGGDRGPVVRPLLVAPGTLVDHRLDGETVAWLHHTNSFVLWKNNHILLVIALLKKETAPALKIA